MSETVTVTLVGFLLARIAEDEQWVAVERRVAPNQRWPKVHPAWTTRVLAECEAKRRIVALHEQWPGDEDLGPECRECVAIDLPCPTLRLLALPYADHPDYRDGWRP